MIKRLKLYTMLNGSQRAGRMCLIIMIVASVLGLMLTYRFSTAIDMFGMEKMMSITGVAAAALTIGLGIFKLINSMYMSNDIELIITLPFAPSEIAVMKVLDFYRLAAAFGIAIIMAPNIGYAVGSGAGPAYIIAALLSGILVPVFALCIIAVLVVLLMTFVKIFRSRQTLKFIGMFILFILMCLYMLLISQKGNGSPTALLGMAANIMDSMKYVCPVVGLLADFAATANLLKLLAAIGMTVAAGLLFYGVTRALYLRGTLNMMDDRSGKPLSDAVLDKECAQKSVMKALTRKEFLSVSRNPAFTLNNFIYGALWPILSLLMIRGIWPMISNFIDNKEAYASWDTLNADAFALYSSIMTAVILFAILLPVVAHSLAATSLTREGNDFMIMKQIPVSYQDQLDAKRKMSLKVQTVSIMIYIVILVIVASVIIGLPVIYGILPIILTWLFLLVNVNSDMCFSIRSSDVSWTSEKEAAKKKGLPTILNVVYWGVALAISAGLVFLNLMPSNGGISLLALCLFGVLMAVYAFILKRRIYVKGEKKIRKMRF